MNESDKQALIRGDATIPYRIYIKGNSNPITEYDIINTDYEDYRYVDGDSIVIGHFVARTITGEINDTNKDLLIEDKEIEVQMGVKTKEGKNLWNTKKTKTQTENGRTIEALEDGRLKITGATTGFAQFTLPLPDLPEGNYKMRWEQTDGDNSNGIWLDYSSTSSRVSRGYDFVFNTKDLKNISLTIVPGSENFIMIPMVTKLDENTTPYEPYKKALSWYSLGNFLITKPKSDDVKDKIHFKAMDYTKKFNKKFDSTLVQFPCTALNLAKSVCNQCGVELGTLDFTNKDFVIDANRYGEKDSCRKVMQDIGKLAYSWVRIGWDNKCYIDFSVQTKIDINNIITNYNYYTLKPQEKVFGPVNRVVIGLSNVDGENVAIEDKESITKNGLHEIKIFDNDLTYTPELRQKAINGAKRLFGFTYTPLEMTTTGHPWLLGNELIEVVDMEGNKLITYAFDRSIAYSGHIKSKLVSKAETKTQLNYVNTNTMTNDLFDTKFIVNKHTKEIQGIVKDTTKISNDVNNNQTEIKTLQTTVTQNKNSVITEITELTQKVNQNSDSFQNSIDNINNTLENGVEKLKNTLVTIDIEGIKVSTNLSAISTLMSNKEFAIRTSSGQPLAFIGYDEQLKKTVARMDNLTVTNYFTSGYHRAEKMKDKKRTGYFFERSDI